MKKKMNVIIIFSIILSLCPIFLVEAKDDVSLWGCHNFNAKTPNSSFDKSGIFTTVSQEAYTKFKTDPLDSNNIAMASYVDSTTSFSNNDARLYNSIPFKDLDGNKRIISFRTRVMVDNINVKPEVSLYQDNGGKKEFYSFWMANGKFYAQDSQVIGSYEINKWYDIEMVCDFNTTMLKVYIDGVKKKELDFSVTSYKFWDQTGTFGCRINTAFGAKPSTPDVTYNAYYDDLNIYSSSDLIFNSLTTNNLPIDTAFEITSNHALDLSTINNIVISNSTPIKAIEHVGTNKLILSFNTNVLTYETTYEVTFPEVKDIFGHTTPTTLSFTTENEPIKKITEITLNTPTNLSQIYGSTTEVTFSATTNPTTNVDVSTIEWYVNNSKQTATGSTFSFTPSSVGNYVIKTKISDNETATSDERTIVVSKATVNFNITNYEKEYTGEPLSATVTPSIAGVLFSVTYGGKATQINAETYPIAITLQDTSNYILGTIDNANFIIRKASRPAPTLLAEKGKTTVTISPISNALYGLTKKGEEGAVVYGESNVFNNLEENVVYTAFIKIAETDNYLESPVTKKEIQTGILEDVSHSDMNFNLPDGKKIGDNFANYEYFTNCYAPTRTFYAKDPLNEENVVMKVTANYDSYGGVSNRSLEALNIKNTDMVAYQIKVMVDSNNVLPEVSLFQTVNGSKKDLYGFYFNKDGTIYASGEIVGNYEINKWYEITCVYDFANNKEWTYINGDLASKSEFDFTNNKNFQLWDLSKKTSFRADAAFANQPPKGETHNVYFDDLKIYSANDFYALEAIAGNYMEEPIKLTFNHSVDKKTLAKENISISSSNGGSMEIDRIENVENKSNEYLIFIKNGFEFETTYHINVTNATDIFKKKIMNSSVSFTTRKGTFEIKDFKLYKAESPLEFLTSGELVAKVQVLNQVDQKLNCSLITAVYKEGQAIKINSSPYLLNEKTTTTLTCPITVESFDESSTYSLKIFLWNSLEGMQPIKGSVIYREKEVL